MYKLEFFAIYLDGLVFLSEIHMDLNAFIVSFFSEKDACTWTIMHSLVDFKFGSIMGYFCFI